MSAFHWEVLPELQQQVLRQLAPEMTRRGFYLAGGTAVALHLGHRRSVDLDWFRPEEIADPMSLAAELRTAGIPFELSSTQPFTLHGSIRGVKTSLLTYRYPLLRPAVSWSEVDCKLAALEDLSCMKLAAIAQRGARRDFIDIFAIGRSGFRLSQMLDLFRDKYGVQDMGHVLMALSYFDDAEREPMPVLLLDTSWQEIKSQIGAWVKELVG